MSENKKIFVLDTNVILHDSSCIRQFQENDVLIPITVLEELDQFKTGNRTINYHARNFLRILDDLSAHKLFNGGVKIGPDMGNISVKIEEELVPDIKKNFSADKPDHHILNIAFLTNKKYIDQKVVLITKDVNLRIKAKALGLLSEDYTTDHVRNLSKLYKGHRLVENVPPEIIDQMYNKPFKISSEALELDPPPVNNESFIFKNPDKSALVYYNSIDNTYEHVEKKSAYRIVPRNAEQTFALNLLMNPEIKLVTMTGKAGTGKTLLTLAASLEMRRHYNQILMARPIVALSNKDLGFLPGDVDEKIRPYMQPLYDNLGVIRDQFSAESKMVQTLNGMLENEKLLITPLAYIRGRSLVKIFFIVDEAQNLTPHEVKTIITRAGEGTKIVFTGDIHQIDHPYLDRHSNGLAYLIDKMQGQNIFGHINLEKGERSQLAEIASNLL
ncbi:MAG: PhoH family protein [Candidatus Marinimicrobia bacterium]|nr:PhoH family protein [Candidatus Neomarinimicrobiota bacterium]